MELEKAILLIDLAVAVVAFVVYLISGIVECITYSDKAEKVMELTVQIAMWCGRVALAVQVYRLGSAILS